MKRKVILGSIVCLLFSNFLITGQSIKNNNMSIHMHPLADIKTTSMKSSNSVEGYQPNQIKSAYGISQLTNQGEGETIAIIDAYGSSTIKNDLNTFNKKYNLESAKLSIFYPNGKPNTSYDNWSIETSLDVEWVHALAPKAYIQLIVSKSDSIDDLMNSVDFASTNGADVVTMSWGESEFSDQLSYDSHFNNKKITYIASTGDNGAGTLWPAVCPNVLAVGGTTLILNSYGNLTQPETAWSGSGGGISSYEMEPEYQKTYGIQSNNKRTIPDVSFSADPKYGVSIYSKKTGWISVGGTSLGAPAWGAFITLLNEKRTIPLNTQDTIYKLAQGNKYSSSFRDIILGNNGSDILDNAHEGYDYVTGLGSPLEQGLYNSLIN